MNGKKIETLEELMEIVRQRRSVIAPWQNEPMPASVLAHMQATTVYNAIKKGLYAYEKPPKRSVFGARSETETKERN